MMAFAAAQALGGIFPETCADGVNAVCRNMEWNFQFSLDQYLAFQRTRGGQSPPPGSTGTWPEPQSSLRVFAYYTYVVRHCDREQS